jgi:23S rRNA pseudouridine1911/1915/1917 synthase
VPAVPYPVVKRGLTKILSTEVQDHQCIVDVEILTGRTHQIRYHLSQAGLPIVGDYLYHPEYEESDELQLTAYQLAFTDMYGEQVVCSVSE